MVHPSNVDIPIEVAFGNDASVRLVHPANASEPIEVTFGNDAVVKMEQLSMDPDISIEDIKSFYIECKNIKKICIFRFI